MYQFLWIFFLYAVLGWCTEVSYAALITGKFVNRGFLNGPVCPIYGFGVVIVLTCLTPLKHNIFLLFIGSVILTSALEWLTGFILEKIFHHRWWNYSDKPFNLDGYICLPFSLAWGLACLFVVEILHPSIEFLICIIPHTLGWTLLGLFCVIMAVDLTATVRTIAKINRRLGQIDELAAKIRAASNEFGENLADKVLDAAEKGSDWKEDLEVLVGTLSERKDDLEGVIAARKAELQENLDDLKDNLLRRKTTYQSQFSEQCLVRRAELEDWKNKLQDLLDGDSFGQRRLLTAFPDMRSTNHKQALERLRRHFEVRRTQGRK